MACGKNGAPNQGYNPYQHLNFPKLVEFLFNEQSSIQGRTLGENLISRTGNYYVGGVVVGAVTGFGNGVWSIEPTATKEQRINRILTGSFHSGRKLGGQLGGIGFMYGGLESGMAAVRGKVDGANSVAAMSATGFLYLAPAGPRAAAIGAATGAAVGVGVMWITLAAIQALKR